jgi:hypothetical protein
MGDAAYAVPALDEADVPIKTIQGLKALRYAERSFTMNVRTLAVLRLADGKRTTSEIRRLDSGRGDAAEILAYLHAMIRPQEHRSHRLDTSSRPRRKSPQSNTCWCTGRSKPWGQTAACAWPCK